MKAYWVSPHTHLNPHHIKRFSNHLKCIAEMMDLNPGLKPRFTLFYSVPPLKSGRSSVSTVTRLRA
jgi:hypothetical protein